MRRVLMILGLGAALAAAPDAAAQVALEVRGGATVGNYTPAAAGLETVPRADLSVGAEFQLRRELSLYGAYNHASFGCEEGFCQGQTVAITSSGAAVGARVHLPRLPWVRAGVLYHAIDAPEEQSGAGIGLELGAGATVPLVGGLRLLPGLTFRTHQVPDGGADARATLVGAGIGLQFAF